MLTVDQALFPLLMELKWVIPEYKDTLIPRLGGLHTSMNFLKAIGQHIQGSGISTVWVESGIVGTRTEERVLTGSDYNKAIRVHKITLQAMWQLLLPQFLDHLDENSKELRASLDESVQANNEEEFIKLLELLSSATLKKQMSSFIAAKTEGNPNFAYLWQYMEMVRILLLFVRAQREGIWKLHLHAFQMMLPFFHRYDHTNYARWGPVYLAQMRQLPVEIQTEFLKGNWVVKGSCRRFNQVDPDQSQEWLNGIGKRSGGIVGITRTPAALCRWTLSYNLRAHISTLTRKMYNVDDEDDPTYNESNPSRNRRDNVDETKVMECLRQANVLNVNLQTEVPKRLQNLVTKDVATPEIEQSLLKANSLGQEKLIEFVTERLVTPTKEDKPKKKLRDTLPRNKAATFSSLYEAKGRQNEKSTVVKADRDVLQRIVTAYDAGRKVDLPNILSHELMAVPLAIADTNGKLRTGNKAGLMELLSSGNQHSQIMPVPGKSTLVIDGQALVMAIGRPAHCNTFNDLADTFTKAVLEFGRHFYRIDVAFDRYRETSIKQTARQKRSRGYAPIRRQIESGSVPLPRSWSNFLALQDNKADLAYFLSEKLLAEAPADKIIVVGGGFKEEDTVKCSRPNIDLTGLKGCHEEADTRMILHCLHSDAECLVVLCQDTDVLLLLIAHYDRMRCKQLWMRAGTGKNPKYLPVHTIRENLKETVPDVGSILSFHAVTGCDTVSFFAGHGKKTSWKVFIKYHELLRDLGNAELKEATMMSAEKFICHLYNAPDAESCNEARTTLFSRCRSPEALPPTTDAAQWHIRRAHYQTMVWKQAHVTCPRLPPPNNMGWTHNNGSLVPKLMTLPPVPDSCKEMLCCSCKTGCTTKRCGCRNADLPCTGACKCRSNADCCCENTGRGADQLGQ